MTPPDSTSMTRGLPAPKNSTPPSLLAHGVAAGLAGCLVGLADGELASRAAELDRLAGAERGAALALGLLLSAPVALVAGLVIGAAALGVRRSAPARRALAAVVGTWRGRALAGLLGLLALAPVAWSLRHKELDWLAIDLRPPALLGGAALLYVLLSRGLRGGPRPLRAAGALLLPLLWLGAAAAYQRAGAGRAAALVRIAGEGPLSAKLLQRANGLLDRDGDGFPRLLCSKGCDCDDTNAAISPAAIDVPGNGIDEDCSGADASPGDADRFAGLFLPGPVPGAPPPLPEPAQVEEPPPAESPGLRRRHKGGKRKRQRHAGKRRRLAAVRKHGAKRAARGRSRHSDLALRRAEAVLKAPAAAAARPNVLFITIDTLRADHLGTYGYRYNTSPRIDAFARDAVVFEQARSAGPATRFSVPAMLTGKHFTEVRRSSAEWPRVDDDEVLLAERMRDAGYFTAAFHSVIYFQDHYGFGQGFTYRDTSFFRSAAGLGIWNVPTAEYVTDHVLQFADKGGLGGKAPFFVWAYYGDPHAPYARHQEFAVGSPRPVLPYDEEIAYSDHHVGRLLDGLRARGLLDNTIVILCSDHGEALDRKEDHGTRHHSKNLYDELIHVPLLVAGPGLKPRRVQTSVSLLDLVPTVLDLLGKPTEPQLRGESLMPYLRGESPPHRPIFAEKHRAEDAVQKAMILWPYKVIMVLPYNDFSIYNLALDPKERENLVDTLPREERERLVGALQYWAKNVLHPIPDNPRH